MAFVIAGAGGVGRETLDAAMAAGVAVEAFLDDALAGGKVRGLPVLRPDDAASGTKFVVGIADPSVRLRLVTLLEDRGLAAATVLHPRAIVGPETTIHDGCVLLANAHVSSSITVGRHTQVHYNATVGHDAVLGERVTVYPGANVSGGVRLEDGATVGSNAVVLQGLVIGAAAFVGAGAVVTHDVPPGAVVVGAPARPLSTGRT